METVRLILAAPFLMVAQVCLFIGCCIGGLPYAEWRD